MDGNSRYEYDDVEERDGRTTMGLAADRLIWLSAGGG